MTNTVAVGAVAPGENADPESTSCFTATDMATAAADGFRDGQLASLIVMPVYRSERGSDGELTYEAKGWNAALDEVARLNAGHLRGCSEMIAPFNLQEFARVAALEMEKHDFHGFEPVVLSVVEGLLSAAPDPVEHVRAMVPSVEQLAEALDAVTCFYDLSADLIAPALRENLIALLAAAHTPEPASPISAQGEGGEK